MKAMTAKEFRKAARQFKPDYSGYETLIARVHRRGWDPETDAKPETVVIGSDGRHYVLESNGMWWKLSLGTGGWHSINVGQPMGFDPRHAS